MNKTTNRIFSAFRGVLVCGTLLLAVQTTRAVEIEEVVSPKGVKAWLMNDPTDQMIVISFSFNGGSLQDPQGKEGLTELMSNLLDKGAGDLDRDAFASRLYATGTSFSFRANSDQVNGSIRLLKGEEKEPLELLALALKAPRFDQDDIDLAKGVMIAALEEAKNDPDEQGWQQFNKEFYGRHPLAAIATPESVQGIAREDLVARHRALFARSNLTVGVAGNIDREELTKVLDELFGDLPETAEVEPVPAPEPRFGISVHQPYDRPQTSIALVYPGLSRESPEIYAANVLTNLLGGGMTSRLFRELREKRGLTYGANAFNDFEDGWGLIYVSTSTRADSASEAMKMAETVMKQAAEGDISQQEVDDAKAFLKGSVVIGALDSTSQIARTLVSLQRNNRPIDYLDQLNDLYDAVTIDDVKAIAAKLLSSKPAVLVVGREDG